MDVLEATIQKVGAMVTTVHALRGGSYPQEHAQRALDEIERIYQEHLDILGAARGEMATSEATIIYCQAVLALLNAHLPLLGLLHRSKHSSNPFEIYDPLLRLARRLLGNDFGLVVSSEWEFSPYTMLGVRELPDIVLIGLPASECANGLLVPLAGHEMGHWLWEQEEALGRYEPAARAGVLAVVRDQWDQFEREFPGIAQETIESAVEARDAWNPSVQWALRQCEEIFCDFVGLRMFGESYLHAFSYLLAPGFAGDRILGYPTDRQRARYLVTAAQRLGIEAPANYVERFVESPIPVRSRMAFRHQLADHATGELTTSLCDHVDARLRTADIHLPSEEEVVHVLQALERFVPASNPASLAAIAQAGWIAGSKPELWQEYRQITDKRVHLNELLLKTAQVLEINHRLAAGEV
jgi:hypothetical protein